MFACFAVYYACCISCYCYHDLSGGNVRHSFPAPLVVVHLMKKPAVEARCRPSVRWRWRSVLLPSAAARKDGRYRATADSQIAPTTRPAGRPSCPAVADRSCTSNARRPSARRPRASSSRRRVNGRITLARRLLKTPAHTMLLLQPSPSSVRLRVHLSLPVRFSPSLRVGFAV